MPDKIKKPIQTILQIFKNQKNTEKINVTKVLNGDLTE